jgi:hypothetical protein
MYFEGKKITYLNSGDWVESLTALEYSQGDWLLYTHPVTKTAQIVLEEEEESVIEWPDGKVITFPSI